MVRQAGGAGRGWWLHADEGCSAVMEEQGEVGARITPTVHGAQPWSVQLNRPGAELRAGGRYAIAFRIRADRIRLVGVGVSRNLAPWDNLGLYSVCEAGPSWRRMQLEFLANADCDATRVHFDIGGDPVPVEVEAVIVRAISLAQRSGQDSAAS
jgi:hypothetical protein